MVAEQLLQNNVMQESVFALLEAKRAEIAAELAAQEAALEYWTAHSALEALLAGASVALESPLRSTVLVSSSALTGGH